MLLAEKHPLPNHLVCEERLLGSAARGHPQPLLADVLDGADRDMRPASHLILQFFHCFKGMSSEVTAQPVLLNSRGDPGAAGSLLGLQRHLVHR
jgi:hypothetical protein